MQKTILITGGAGFVGSNLAIYLKRKLGKITIICFDNLIRRGSELNKARLCDEGIKFIKGDIRNQKSLLQLPKINVLIECSAEPSVLASYKDPQYNIQTNLIGTIHCLELAKRDAADVIFLSTSRVYPVEAMNSIPFIENQTRFDWKKEFCGSGCSYKGINEDFTVNGIKSLYGATKLSSEQIMIEYLDMYGLKGVINRFGVIGGPWQMGKIDQGIVGFWVSQHKFRKPLSYIGFDGAGKQVRDVIHVDDVCRLIFKQLKNISKINGKIFNVGGGRKNSFSLKELTRITQNITNEKLQIGSVKMTRKADVRIYITDNSKIEKILNWSLQKNVEEVVYDVDRWINQYSSQLKKILG